MKCPLCEQSGHTRIANLDGWHLCEPCAGFVVWEHRKWRRR